MTVVLIGAGFHRVLLHHLDKFCHALRAEGIVVLRPGTLWLRLRTIFSAVIPCALWIVMAQARVSANCVR